MQQENQKLLTWQLLKQSRCRYKGIGTDNLIINGVKELNQVSHSVVSDRIEAGSFAIASSITMGNVEINNINPKNLTEFINVLKLTGSKVEIFENSMKVSCSQDLKLIMWRQIHILDFLRIYKLNIWPNGYSEWKNIN